MSIPLLESDWAGMVTLISLRLSLSVTALKTTRPDEFFPLTTLHFELHSKKDWCAGSN